MDAVFAAPVSQLRDGAQGQMMVSGRRDEQRKKVIITAVVLAVVALAFYFATFIRHWP